MGKGGLRAPGGGTPAWPRKGTLFLLIWEKPLLCCDLHPLVQVLCRGRVVAGGESQGTGLLRSWVMLGWSLPSMCASFSI